MTTLYRSVLIESAEQAEALPLGTIAAPMYEDGPDFTYALVRQEAYEPWCNSDGSHARGHGDLDGFAALVPIELREQTHRLHGRKAEVPWGELIQITYPGAGETDESRDWQCTSYSTPWEEA